MLLKDENFDINFDFDFEKLELNSEVSEEDETPNQQAKKKKI